MNYHDTEQHKRFTALTEYVFLFEYMLLSQMNFWAMPGSSYDWMTHELDQEGTRYSHPQIEKPKRPCTHSENWCEECIYYKWMESEWLLKNRAKSTFVLETTH